MLKMRVSLHISEESNSLRRASDRLFIVLEKKKTTTKNNVEASFKKITNLIAVCIPKLEC